MGMQGAAHQAQEEGEVLAPGSDHPIHQRVGLGGTLRGGPVEGVPGGGPETAPLQTGPKLVLPSIYILARAWYGNLGVLTPILEVSNPCVLALFGGTPKMG